MLETTLNLNTVSDVLSLDHKEATIAANAMNVY